IVVTAKEDILRIVNKLIWDIKNQIETYIVDSLDWVFKVSEKPGEPIKKLTAQEEKIYKSAKEYWICNKVFKENNLKKVYNYDYIIGNYRGLAYSICNLQLQIKPEEFKLPIHFYNLDKFDTHLIS
ncbi:13443_t:CDS:2, partial [Gigaspora margarita]